ncbi:unnamed protein product, partial [Pylaiella littoralis]
ASSPAAGASPSTPAPPLTYTMTNGDTDFLGFKLSFLHSLSDTSSPLFDGLPEVLALAHSRNRNPAVTSVGDLLCAGFFDTFSTEDQELLLRLVAYLRSPLSAFRRVKAHPTRLTHYSGAPVEHSPRRAHDLHATRGRGS